MKINEKNKKGHRNSYPDDRHISQDFSEIFDVTENILDLETVFIDARAKKGLTQQDVSKILKVRVSAVKQIEKGEELKELGSAYNLGFLRSYAKLVDLDPDFIIKNYKSLNQEKEIKFDYNFPDIIKEKKSLFPVIALFSFLFSLVIYSSWYYLNLNNLENKNSDIAKFDIDNRNSDYVKVEEKQNESLNKTNKIKDENLVTIKNKISENFITENSVNKVIESTKNEAIDLLETKTTNETSAIANERLQNEEMVLRSSGNSWVEIEDLDGNSYLTRLMRAGETYVVPNKKGLTLSTGNAGVLSLTFGSIHVSRLGTIGEVISSRPLNIEAFKKR